MAYLPQTQFQRRQNYLLNGGDSPEGPEYNMEGDIRYPTSPLIGSRTSPDAGSLPSFGGRRSSSGDYRQGVQVGRGTETPSNLSQQTAPQGSTQTVQPAAQESSSQTLAPPDPISQPPSFQRTGTLQQRLFQPLQTGAERGQESLGEAAAYFQQEAGPSRTYESIGGQDLLKQAFQGGQAQDLEAARGLVGAEYTGPQGLDSASVAALQNLVGQLQTRQKALGTGGGLQTLIQQSVAGLTPGQALFEAKRLLPETERQARDIGFQTVAPLSGRLMQEREKAQEFAKQRTQEERDIAERSRGFLTGERGKIEGDLASKIEAARQQQADLEQKYFDVREADPSGRLAALRRADPELAAQFDTETRQKDIEADRLYNQILADPKYASIAGIDPLGMKITKRGKRFYSADGEDLRRVIPDKATRALLYERQKELEDKFSSRAYSPFRRTGEPAEYSAFKPLYGEGGFEALDPVDYIGFDPGMSPTQANLSTEKQRDQFNNIQTILGNFDKIGKAEPFRAAQILGEVEKYLEAEQNKLDSIKGNLSTQQKEWANQVRKMRKSARKAKGSEAGKIAGIIVGDVLAGGLVDRQAINRALH